MKDDFPHHFEFVFGSVFPADDPVAQFIVSLSAAANDAVFLHDLWFGDDTERSFSTEQNTWFMRQAASQLWEVRELMHKVKMVPEVAAWLEELDDSLAPHLVRLRVVLDELAEGESKDVLAKVRNHTWHYPPPGKTIKAAMVELSNETLSVTLAGPAVKDGRASFADAVMFKIGGMGQMTEGEFQMFVAEVLRPGVQAVIDFGVRAYPHWIRSVQND